jgi:ADP-heptose:LPS heptosyltransferase
MRDRPIVYAWIGARDPIARRRLRTLASRLALAKVVRGDGPEHAAALYARQVGVDEPQPFAWPATPSTDRIERMCAALRRPTLAVHAGAGSIKKRWARAAFAEIAARWQADGGGVVEIVGPADHDVGAFGVARVVDWPLPEVAALLARVDAYLGNDSGVTHLAASVGVAGVAIYGPTAACRWSPFGGRILPIQDEAYSADGITSAAVSVERVWRALAPGAAGASHHA